MKKIILIPSYEPDEKLIELLKELNNKNMDVIIVDDGSGKNYKEIFEKAKEYGYIISYQNNKGKGYALKTGFKYIKERYKNEYIVITMDSDGQHSVKDAIKLIKYLEENTEELVLGKRIRSKKKTPFKSRIGNSITRFIYKISTGIDIYDTQTGLRGFTNKLMDYMLEIEGDRYEYEMNVLLRFPQLGIKMKEIEIETIYIQNNSKTHFNAIKDSYKIYKQIIKFSCSSLISFFIDYILYTIFMLELKNIILANILARIISGTANYILNKKVVFKSKEMMCKSLIQYIALATFILILNTVILKFLVYVIGINELIAKIIVEILLFIISWIIQKRFIFNKSKGGK